MRVIRVRSVLCAVLAVVPLTLWSGKPHVTRVAAAGQTIGAVSTAREVRVSTPAQLQDAVTALASDTTIIIAAGTYNLRSTLRLEGSYRNVVLRGETGNPREVVLVGRGMTNSDFRTVPHGISVGADVQGVTIADLTIRDVFQHAIHFEPGSERPRVSNVHLLDAGQQFIKATLGADTAVSDGIVERSTIEYTTAASGSGATGGIDIAGGSGWIIRDNVFRNIRNPSGQLAGPAVLIHQGAQDSVVERNTFINCQREIAFGLERRTPFSHAGGVIRNNFLYREPSFLGDVAIQLASSPRTEILHNTIFASGTFVTLVEARFPETADIGVMNNLLDGQIQRRDGATGRVERNHTAATADMFVNAPAGDLHLSAAAGTVIDAVPTLPNAASDRDGQKRPIGPAADYGADEFAGDRIDTAAALVAEEVEPSLMASTTSSPGSTADTSGQLPAPWQTLDIGKPALTGKAAYNSGWFVLSGAGVDIWDASDQFRFVYQAISGDGEVAGCVQSIHAQDGWTKAGVMFRETLKADSRNAYTLITPGRGAALQYRAEPGQLTRRYSDVATAPLCLRLVRKGHLFTAYRSTDGGTWSAVASHTISMSSAVYVGLAVTSHDEQALATAAFDHVSVRTSGSNQPPQVALSAPAGGAKFSAPATIAMSATASDPDGSIARVEFFANSKLIGSDSSSPYSATWSNVAAGNYTLTAVAHDNKGATASSAPVSITVSSTTNQPPYVTLTVDTATRYVAPASIALSASAHDVDGSIARVEFHAGGLLVGSDSSSPYSVTWKYVPAGTYTLSARAIDNAGAATISSGVNLTVEAASSTTLPALWQTQDIGQPSEPGAATYSSGTFALESVGTDIWNTADRFRFVYQPLNGDGEIAACPAAIDNVHRWAKAGVMFRETLGAGARHASAFVSAAKGVEFQDRSATGGHADQNALVEGSAPHCVRLVRSGSVFTAYQSADGVNWVAMGTKSVTMGSAAYVGLAMSNPDSTRNATASLDRVSVKKGSASNQPPFVQLTAPASNSSYVAPASITMSASARDDDGTIARVEFYAGGLLVGTDSSSPFSATWSNVAAGTYTLSAKAVDNAGASTHSAGVNITVTAADTALPWFVVFTASPDHQHVSKYRVEFFQASADPASSSPVRVHDAGKPTPVNGEITVDVTAIVQALPAGSYFTTVTAINSAGESRSAPSATFVR